MTENKYKYWFFYIKPEFIDTVYTEENSLLYAYTDDKDYYKAFKDQRDMSKFFILKKEIDREEVNYLAKYFTRQYLIKKEVKTKTDSSKSTIINYDLIITKYEDHMIQSTSHRIIMFDLWKYAWINPYIFKNKYLKALDKLGFKNKFDTMNTWKRSSVDIDRIGKNIQADMLAIFINEFGYLLSLKKEGNNT